MIHKLEQHTKRLSSGIDAKFVSFVADDLNPVRLNLSAQERAIEWAHHIANTHKQSMRVWALPNVSDMIPKFDPNLHTFENELFFSLRSLLAKLLRNSSPESLSELHSSYQSLIKMQIDLGNLAVAQQDINATSFVTELVGSLGSIRTLGRQQPNNLLLNSHYFAITKAEFDTPHTVMGDCAGFWIQKGVVKAPLLTPRCTLFRSSKGWQMRQILFEELQIQFPDGTFVNEIPGAQVFRRGFTENGATPKNSDSFELILVEKTVVAMRDGGGGPIPYSGLVVSLPEKPSQTLIDAFTRGNPVTYSFKHLESESAIQVGPQLLRGGKICIQRQSFEDEAFFVERGVSSTIPYRFPDNADKTHAARSAIGINGEGHLVGVAIEGSSSDPRAIKAEYRGATLLDTAEILLELGVVDAMNLDGGGSTQLFAGSGALTCPSDKRGIHFASYERLVPTALVFS